MKILELGHVVNLLRSEVERAGGQTKWARNTGVNRSVLNRVLAGHKPPTKTIAKALKLRIVFVLKRKAPR